MYHHRLPPQVLRPDMMPYAKAYFQLLDENQTGEVPEKHIYTREIYRPTTMF